MAFSADSASETKLKETRPVGPHIVRGKVVRGFGRGSKQLGIPTANLDPLSFLNKDVQISPVGVYFGFAGINNGPIYKAVLSVGWNPFFKNKEKTIVCQLYVGARQNASKLVSLSKCGLSLNY